MLGLGCHLGFFLATLEFGHQFLWQRLFQDEIASVSLDPLAGDSRGFLRSEPLAQGNQAAV